MGHNVTYHYKKKMLPAISKLLTAFSILTRTIIDSTVVYMFTCVVTCDVCMT